MRTTIYRTLAKLALTAASAAALGATAGTASADVSNPTYSNGGTMGASQTYACRTGYTWGVNGEYGAWGEFIDGCTVRLNCPVSEYKTNDVVGCAVSGYSYIDNYFHRGERVTMNSRTRRFERGGHLYAWRDGSCDALDHCQVNDSGAMIAAGQSASVQCNGVRSVTSNYAQDYCQVGLSYRTYDPNNAQEQGRGQCTDWALYRRPDLAGVVNGNAQAWTAEASAAGRTVSKTPSPGALMVLQPGVMGAGVPTGHVAYVESVSAGSFVISEQNWNGIQTPTTRTIQTSSLPGSGVDFIG